MMNDWTLAINDPKIRQQFDRVRQERITSIFKPLLIVYCAYWWLALIYDLNSNDESVLKRNFWGVSEWSTLIIWGIFYRFKKEY
jgi:hypothetical protein